MINYLNSKIRLVLEKESGSDLYINIDSIDLEDEFQIEFHEEDIMPENLKSINSLNKIISKKII